MEHEREMFQYLKWGIEPLPHPKPKHLSLTCWPNDISGHAIDVAWWYWQELLWETFRREAHYYGLCLECPLSVGFRFHWHWQLKCMFSSIMTTEWLVRKRKYWSYLYTPGDYRLGWMLLNMISRLHSHHNLIYEVELIKNNLGSIIGHGTLKLYKNVTCLLAVAFWCHRYATCNY